MSASDSSAAAALHAFARVLAPYVARAVVAELRAGSNEMIDQTASPLGLRRHCAAARRLVNLGAEGAAIVGRRHMLSRERLNEELAKVSKKQRDEKPSPVNDGFASLCKRYGAEPNESSGETRKST